MMLINKNHSNYIVLVVLVIVIGTIGLERNSDCETPNGESAKCIAVANCKPILEAITTRNETAINFAKESQCGYDSAPLVCCGTTGYPRPASHPSFYDIFTKTPPVTQPTIFSKAPPSAFSQSNDPRNTLEEPVNLRPFETNQLPDRTVCGIEKEVDRVYGGQITGLREFPWMVALEYIFEGKDKSAGIRCGGTLISNKYVLTAAHCINIEQLELISAWLGDWRLSTEIDCIRTKSAIMNCADKVQKVAIRDQITHPYHDSITGNNDIGLLRLENNIKFTDYIRPICLPPTNLPQPPLNTLLTVAGWGLTENGNTSDIKLKVEVPWLSNEDCNAVSDHRLSANQLCAGGEEGKDSCKGDSGGPIMRVYTDSINSQVQWYLEGVVSRGVGASCGGKNLPAIYTRVSRYVIWIVNVLSNDD